ncbi:Formyl-CoA transferase [uncultured delta proteobacterium]|uniref:Formyl-CoA transferase n=1 Tax=uncultured delta proteobacterium TaxID=34034 RepID=A0A212JJT7_9DELT|nr:Formyl-CoA transferase [uncultured delta proteobacterium]
MHANALSGVTVLDLSTMMAGPFGAMMLADLGAEVIKVETLEGDGTRTFQPHFKDGDSLYFHSLNKNKKSIAIDLKSQKGIALFYDLVAKADVVWDNFRAGVKEKLKIDYDNVVKHNPKIISCSITAFGTANPYDDDQPSFDLCVQALSGVLDMTGEPDRPPVKMGVPMGDLGSGWYGVVGVLAALFNRERTGKGQKVDIAMLDGLVSLHTYEAAYYLNSGTVPTRIGTAHRSVVPYQIFPTKNIYIAIVGTLDKFWASICSVLGMPEWAADERFKTLAGRFKNRELVVSMMSEKLVQRDCEEWVAAFRKVKVPCGPVNPMDKALNEPLLTARNMVVAVERGGETIKLLGNPVKMSGNTEVYKAPPRLGENTDEVLSRMAGLAAETIATLRQESVIK